MRSSALLNFSSGALLLAVFVLPVSAQTKPPTISARQFTGGSAKVTVTGDFSFDQDVAIDKVASVGDGEMTWLQFGTSGSPQPNVAITYGELGEVGIAVAQGKLIATGGVIVGEKSECSGSVDVKPNLITGKYKCIGLTSYDQTTRKMGKVNVEVSFTAKS